MEIRLNKDQVKVGNAVSNEDYREILKGVHLTNQNGRYEIQACDGNMLVRCPITSDEIDIKDDEKMDVVIPGEALLKAQSRGQGINGVIVKDDGDGEEVKMMGITKHYEPSTNVIKTCKLEGNYPDLDLVYPSKEVKLQIAFMPELLKKWLKVLPLDEPVRLTFRGKSEPVEFESESADGYIISGLIMPALMQR
jgi:hypothetical protein